MRQGIIRMTLWACFGVAVVMSGCSTPTFQTVTIFDSPNRVVALQAMPEAYEGKGYDHPASLSPEELSRLLQGVRVQRGLLSTSQHPAFSDTEIRLFAPHLVSAFQRATDQELVTFFEKAEINDEYELTTSGGLYVAGGNLYVVMSNFSVKTPVWQDNEQYEAPFRNRPLEQMDPEPGGLTFVPPKYVVQSPDGELGTRLKGKPWQVAIRYQDYLRDHPIVKE